MLKSGLGQIFRHMSRRRLTELILLITLLIGSSLAELVTIAAVVPFISLLSGSATPEVFEPLFGAIGPQDRLLGATLFFGVAVVVSGLLRIALSWTTQSFSFGFGHDLSVAIQTRLLHQPYAFHTSRNSSELIAAHDKVLLLVQGVILPVLNALTAAVTSVFIIAVLLYIDAFAAGIAAVSLAAVYFAVSRVTRDRLHRHGETINSDYSRRVKAVQESLGGIRDVIVDHSQPVHLNHFARVSRSHSNAERSAAFIASMPRFLVEAVGLVLIAILALVLSGRNGGFTAALPVLGAIALSAQRLLPLLHQVYHGWAQARTGTAVTEDLAALLELTVPAEHDLATPVLSFQDSVRLRDVSFRYPGRSDFALANVTLSIPRGARLALTGRTGSGKSTLIDLVMGLLDPTQGSISIDGVRLNQFTRSAWQANIAHVPQSIFVADVSIVKNIALGSEHSAIDPERVRWAARLARADEFIDGLPQGYDTLLGERGVRLSGGQRQRIGIARALYKKAPLLILDEATNALDQETEDAVLDSIDGMGSEITLIMIAHRTSSIERCDTLVRLEVGRVASITSPEHLAARTGQPALHRETPPASGAPTHGGVRGNPR